ncbi:caveolin-1-like [Asterias amurensis]|uniref:caveolin-1-like n=1 Tax=Asterias amurensis TaxID=7602 RepID=UPI003AB8EB4E
MVDNSNTVGAWPSGAARRNDTELQQMSVGDDPSQPLITITDEEDIYRTSAQIKVEYDEVFQEPAVFAKYSIRKISRLIYSWTQIIVYIIFSILFGILLSFLWGIIFALLNFFSVFIMQPTAKALFVILRTSSMMVRATVRSYLDPVYESFGMCFSRIKGKVTLTGGILPTTIGRAAIKEM